MIKILHIALFLIPTLSLFADNIVINGGFERSQLAPWYEYRTFGEFRPWMIGTHNPAEGQQYAFCLGRVELRQDITPVPADKIGMFTFLASQQFTGRGAFWAEIFYSDGTSTGFIDIQLEGSFIWQTIDLLPFLDHSKMLSGFSIIGIPNNVLLIDDFQIVADMKQISIRLSDNRAMLSWFGKQGYSYQLLHSTNLRDWSLLKEFSVIMPGTLSHEWQIDQDRVFFRLKLIKESSE